MGYRAQYSEYAEDNPGPKPLQFRWTWRDVHTGVPPVDLVLRDLQGTPDRVYFAPNPAVFSPDQKSVSVSVKTTRRALSGSWTQARMP